MSEPSTTRKHQPTRQQKTQQQKNHWASLRSCSFRPLPLSCNRRDSGKSLHFKRLPFFSGLGFGYQVLTRVTFWSSCQLPDIFFSKCKHISVVSVCQRKAGRTADKNMPPACPDSLSTVINHTQAKTKSLAEMLSLFKRGHHGWFQTVRTLKWYMIRLQTNKHSPFLEMNFKLRPSCLGIYDSFISLMTVHLKMMSLQGHFHFSHNVLNETLACKTGSLACKIILYWMTFIQSGNKIFSRQFLYFLKIQLCLIASSQLFCLVIIKINGGGGLQE